MTNESSGNKSVLQKQQEALLKWQDELQSICLQENQATLLVENNVDLDFPPSNLKYITKREAGSGVEIPSEPVVYCKCPMVNGRWMCGADKVCCPENNDSNYSYRVMKNGIRSKPGYVDVIFECNSKCDCDENCPNRVVQKGRKIPLIIFKTEDRGWGVRAMQLIPKGTFVLEYVGEVITIKEAKKRGSSTDPDVQSSYLFDMDLEQNGLGGEFNAKYSVDAKKIGNVAHFINHSCEANMIIRGVYIECQDKCFPHLAFFASKDIRPGEEITFDYFPQIKYKKESKPNAKRMKTDLEQKKPCLCGAEKCKGVLLV